jgi:hypothetical protein
MLTSDVRALENRLLHLVPLLAQLKCGSGASSLLILNNGVPDRFQDRLETCEQTNSVLKDLVSTLQEQPTQTASMPSSAMEAQVLELQTQMKQLQLKVVGKGVQIGNKTFQSFEDVKVWVSAQLPNHRYGLFVAGVSLFKFFSAGHINAKTTYSSFYSQHRTGFKSTFEARVASSVQNLFPTVFRKSDSNVDTSDALPALTSPDRWDSNKGSTGLRHQIMRNMSDVELQIQETINPVLGDYLEAQHLARECLHQSKRFALELCQFITLDYQKWTHRGHSKCDAWKMTAVCICRIFEELYSERVIAHDVYDQGNPTFTAAKYLWATWRAHSVMEKYLCHQFYEHPSISAVLARHLADNYVKPDDAQASKIRSLEAQLKTLDANQKPYNPSMTPCGENSRKRSRSQFRKRRTKCKKTGRTKLPLGAVKVPSIDPSRQPLSSSTATYLCWHSIRQFSLHSMLCPQRLLARLVSYPPQLLSSVLTALHC